MKNSRPNQIIFKYGRWSQLFGSGSKKRRCASTSGWRACSRTGSTRTPAALTIPTVPPGELW